MTPVENAIIQGLHMGNFASHRSPEKTARYILECLHSLPVEQKAQAFGFFGLLSAARYVIDAEDAGWPGHSMLATLRRCLEDL